MEYRLIAGVFAVLAALSGAIALVAGQGERFVGAQELIRFAID